MVSRGYPSEKYHGSGIFEFDQAKALAKTEYKTIKEEFNRNIEEKILLKLYEEI